MKQSNSEKTLTHSSTLPDLIPNVRQKREQKVTPKVLQWFRTTYHSNCAIEIKATNKNTIPEKALQDHQRLALQSAKGRGIVHKIADNKRRLPFDAFMLINADAFVVACFTAHGRCLVIPVDKWKGASPETPCDHIIKL